VNAERNKFKHTRRMFDTSGEDYEVLLRKDVFPHDWFDSLEKLSETKPPPKEAFHSMLHGCDISNEVYERAQNLWKHFEMKIMRDFHNLY